MVTIIPGIFEKDSHEIERKIRLVSPYCRWIQIDIADSTLVSSETPTVYPFLTKYTDNLFEAHLMVSEPETYVRHLVGSGFKRIIGHVECQDPREFLAEARSFDCEVGLALDVETPVEEIEPFLEELDEVLIMTVLAGASGQPFEERAVSKIKAIHRNLPDLPIEVDGGINEDSIKSVIAAGATRIISTSYIFQDEKHIHESIQRLASVAGG